MINQKKIMNLTFTCFLTLVAIFFLVRLAPGDPVERLLGPEATYQEIQNYRNDLGLNETVFLQFKTFFLKTLQGDLGKSLFKRKDVMVLLSKHFKPTLTIAFFTIFISSFFGVILGLISAIYKSKKPDHLLRLFSILALSFPIFSLGPILVYIFSVKLQAFPVSEWGDGGFKYLFLPILTLVIPLSSVLSRFTRNKFLEEMKAPWIEVLKAKGLSSLSINLRVLKVCSPSLLNVIAIQLSVILAGTMITETIFDIPGMGSLLLEGIQNRDYPVVQGVILYSTLIYMIIYFLTDYIAQKCDPRISD